jgi:hypothetical protein
MGAETILKSKAAKLKAITIATEFSFDNSDYFSTSISVEVLQNKLCQFNWVPRLWSDTDRWTERIGCNVPTLVEN